MSDRKDQPDRVGSANQPGQVTTGNAGLPSELDPQAPHGTGAHTAGPQIADALPRDAVMTPASELTRREGGTKED